MALSRRYHPSWPPEEAATIGMDFSDVVPPGIALATGTLTILTNTSPSQPSTDFTQGPVQTQQRQAWCLITGGTLGQDYQFRWTVTDGRENIWSRTALLLCAETS